MGGMRKARRLYFLNVLYSIKHWSWRNSMVLIWNILLGVGTFMGMNYWLRSPGRPDMYSTLCTFMAGLFLLFFIYSLFSSSKTWFSSANAFYFTTAPLPFGEIFLYNWMDTLLQGIRRLAGHLFLPALAAWGLAIQGGLGVFKALLCFAAGAAIAVNMGFLAEFFILRHKSRPLWWALALVGGMALSVGLYILAMLKPLYPAVAIVIALILSFVGVRSYGSKVFRNCLDAAELSFDFDFKSPGASRLVLEARALPGTFRAYLYKELVTDRRNVFFYARYALVFIFLMAYVPLSHWRVLEKAGLAGALIYCLWAVLLNFHETFATSFIKEGSMIAYLLPWSRSNWMGTAKLLAAVLEELPFLLLAALLITWRWSTGLSETSCLALTLGLLLTCHLVMVTLIAALFTNLEHREGGLLAGMIYEYVFAGINPGLLSWYTVLLVLPGAFTGAFLGWQTLKPGVAPWGHIWFFDGLLLLFILLALYLQFVLYRRKLRHLMA